MPFERRSYHGLNFHRIRSKFETGNAKAHVEATPLLNSDLKPGDYRHSGPNDVRSPCPVLNALANHGYLQRDGRNITSNELNAALAEVGIAWGLRAFFAGPTYNEYFDPEEIASQQPKGFLASTWGFLLNPWIIFSNFGFWRAGQVDCRGNKVIDLDQVAIPGVGEYLQCLCQRRSPTDKLTVEHDISLTRRDHQQPQGNVVLQQDLAEDLLASSSDGGHTLTLDDFAKFRVQRIETQLNENPGLTYGFLQHGLSCAEIGLVLYVFGDRKSVPVSHVRALFQEERLPMEEGWKKRTWWKLGFIELFSSINTVKAAVGLAIEDKPTSGRLRSCAGN
jgi:hypothetical protein